jgi:kynureninase
MDYQFSETFAREMDETDPLKSYKSKFFIPKANGKEVIYFCGNSLGLQPKTVKDFVQKELDRWAEKGVEGHFEGDNPWIDARLPSKPILATLVGAKNHEVVAMNSLTENLHMLMVSFYQPTKTKFKILTESEAFSSDRYMMESQVRFHGFDPQEAIVEIYPREGEHTLRTEDILSKIREYKDELALVLMSGVQYYTGQFFDLEAITATSRKSCINVGFDLAHAVGNVPLKLHDWGVDFAAWCSYKYLNSGPGNIAGIFVHEKHASNVELPRFAGWWGHEEKERFRMERNFKPMYGADGWQVSNNNVLALAAHYASLEIFQEVGMENLRKKSELLTGYLEFLVGHVSEASNVLEIISPANPQERGCQLSLLLHKEGKRVFDKLYSQGLIGDWRNPNVMRLSPVPLYNSFEEVYHAAKILSNSLNTVV